MRPRLEWVGGGARRGVTSGLELETGNDIACYSVISVHPFGWTRPAFDHRVSWIEWCCRRYYRRQACDMLRCGHFRSCIVVCGVIRTDEPLLLIFAGLAFPPFLALGLATGSMSLTS